MSYTPYCDNCGFSYLRHDADGGCGERRGSFWSSTTKRAVPASEASAYAESKSWWGRFNSWRVNFERFGMPLWYYAAMTAICVFLIVYGLTACTSPTEPVKVKCWNTLTGNDGQDTVVEVSCTDTTRAGGLGLTAFGRNRGKKIMEAKDILLAPEPLEHRTGLVTCAYQRNGQIRFGGVCRDLLGDSWIGPDIFSASPALQAFIEKARQHFAPKKSCGELKRGDLWGLVTRGRVGLAPAIVEEYLAEWATARNIQLPEAS